MLQYAAAQKMPAIAMTDQMNLFALVKFYRQAMAAGVKPLVGAEIWVANEKKPEAPYVLILLCQNTTGYQHLKCLLSRAYIEGQHHGKAIIKAAWLQGSTDG